MPIRPENRERYPKNWKAISKRIREERAGNRCEFVENGARCAAVNGQPHPVTGSRVVLTCMHLDHVPETCEDTNLLAACQRCHNRYDAAMRRAGIRARAREALGIADMVALMEAVHAP